MDFAIKVLLSFLVGGLYVSGVIWLSEKLGSKIGAAVAGLPSTILIGLAFINITEGPVATRSAVSIVPLMFTPTLIYGLIYIASSRRWHQKNVLATLLAVAGWLAVTLVAKGVFGIINFTFVAIIGFLSLLIFRYLFRNFSIALPNNLPLPRYIYSLRFIVGGGVIALSVVAARIAGPVWGGIISSFPAMLGCIFYFLNKSQGGKFLEGFMHQLPVGYFSSFTFLVLIHHLLTKTSTVWAFVLAMAGAVAYTLLNILTKNST